MAETANWHDPRRIDSSIAVAHSILDADSLAAIVPQYWDSGAPLSAQLVQHGQNDWYRCQTAENQYAIRVLKNGSRSAMQLRDELQWVSSLAAQGLPVCPALRTRDGAAGLELAAPEGPRLVCLYPWLDGATLDRRITAAQAHAAGLLLAQIHGCATPVPLTRRHSLADKLSATAPALESALGSQDERQRVTVARRVAAPALKAESRLPQGSLHGDLHFGNLRQLVDGRLIAMDFDDCGFGALSTDLTAFIWRRRCESLDAELDTAFLRGYETLRPLSAPERQALPGLLAARALYLAGVLARDRNLLGSVPGFDKPWLHYLQLAEEFAANASAQTR